MILCVGVIIAGLFVVASAVPTARAASGSGWTIVTSPNVGPPQSDFLVGSTCVNSWNCWAVGAVFSTLGNGSQPSATIDHWNGSTWSVGPNVAPASSQASLLWDVTCVTASDCWAVGAQGTGNGKLPNLLAENWNGSTWSVVPTPDINGYLLSVTCTGASSCVAVGIDVDAKNNPLGGIILSWNGSEWSQSSPQAPAQPYSGLNSVTCAGPTDCWAVGFAGPNQIQYNFVPGVAPNVIGSSALVEHWNGSQWLIVPTPAPMSPGGQYLSSTTCSGASNCWATGATMDAAGNPSTTLVDHWDGTAWVTVPSPNPATNGSLLTSVTCMDAADCWAAGASGWTNNSTPTPFIENWNGSAWSVEPSPNVVAFGYLSGLTCVQGVECFTIGFSATNLNNNTVFQTLIEQLQVPASTSQGIWTAGSDGGVFSFGTAGFHGSASGVHMNRPVVGMAATPDGGGYWLVASDGGVFSFGDASFDGSTGSMVLNKPIVGMAATPDGGGYWLVASDGGVFSFGDASFDGSTGSMVLNKPIVGMAVTPDGGGYWLVASDGGVFSFGDASFDGSTGSMVLNKPIVGMAATPDGGGYWLVASDGGVFSFGDASFYGSVPGQGIVTRVPVEGIVATPDGGGYWVVGGDGAVYAYGDASYLGSLTGYGLAAPIVAAAPSI